MVLMSSWGRRGEGRLRCAEEEEEQEDFVQGLAAFLERLDEDVVEEELLWVKADELEELTAGWESWDGGLV